MPATPADLWRSAAAADPVRPFITAYDHESGGRVELSYATFGNWVAKTSNMLVDGFATQPGDRVALALPVHWQTLVWLVACWSTGTVPVLVEGDAVPEADVAVADAARIGAALDTGANEVVGASLHPLGAPMADLPSAAVDYAVEVRGHGDLFRPTAPADPSAVALEEPGAGTRSGAELVALATEKAAEWRLTATDRVAIITTGSDSVAPLGPGLAHFVAALHGSAALMLSPDIDSATLQSRLGMERVTAIAGALPEPLIAAGPIRSLT
ncbi:uncharacterized protein (TIGR03089 family) [Murinocardiopsis flavida]|uniref:Uncharacterized protein (TIGR03089 family) n=1 Tax=Murinocardiopsis flavida TaxID=645275 RepID=A0A2P8DIM6_9ACTN|nr:TIGR03089 family protein [Murinocardiopsis flavida]PSK97075.1 uncharacterized protein (TIGR03089 family) [Murinocardiopsis flavida]